MTTWDVRDKSGALVTDLSGLAEALGTRPEQAVKQLLSDPILTAAAPASLLADVKASAKPGGGTPPPISNGSFVSFSGGKGRVDLIVSKGKVPGVEDDVEGTEKSPAARVVVWADGKPTKKKRGFSTHTLKRIAPLDKPEKKSHDAAATLVSLVAGHDRRCSMLGSPEHERVTGSAVKAAFQRGVGGWPGAARTSLSQTEWALARAEHLIKVAAGQVEGKSAGHDLDLLHPDHPLRNQRKVYVDAADLDATVRNLLDSTNI